MVTIFDIQKFSNISNSKSNTLLAGTAYADTIYNEGSSVTINAGTGNDTIVNYSNSTNIYQYDSNSGNDTIYGFNENDTISIASGNYSTAKSGEDFILKIGSSSITLKNSANIKINVKNSSGNLTIYNQKASRIIKGTSNNDTIINNNNNVTVQGLAGNDSIDNYEGDSVKIDAGAGNDPILNSGSSVTIYAGAGDDYISNYGLSVRIDAGAGNDSIDNYGSSVRIDAGAGNDSIYQEYGSSVTINAGAGNDSIYNSQGLSMTINAGAGGDSIYNYGGDSVKIDAGAGDDYIYNYRSSSVTIDAGAGNDSIYHGGRTLSSDYYYGHCGTIIGGKGNDMVSIDSYSKNNLVQYASGDGNDTIYGLNSDDTLKIIGAGYSTVASGDDLIFTVGTGKITVVDGVGSNFKINGTLEGGNSTDGTPPAGITVKAPLLTATNKFKGNAINLNDYNPAVTKVNASALSQAVNITGNNSNNSLKGGKGADTISGGSGKNTLTGGSGKDIFIYGGGNDVITDYKPGEDKISVNYTSSTVKGSDVILTTGKGTMSLKGAKDKVITFTDGSEKIFFGDISYAPLETGLTYDAKRTVLTASSKFTGTEIDWTNYLPTVTKINASAVSQGLNIVGNDSANSLKGGKGADTISGGLGKNTLTGGNGADIFVYAGGNDLITDYKPGEDKISANYIGSSVKGSDVILTTSNGNLTIKGAKDKVVTFTDGSEKIFYGSTSYTPLAMGLSYDSKRTILTASSKYTGNTINLNGCLSSVNKVNASALTKAINIVGNNSNNSIKSGKGADTIFGGSGNDTLTGGAGNDVFVYESGTDVITDYAAGQDKVRLSNATITGSSLSGANVVLKTSNGNITIQNGKNKKITVIDSSGKETTQIYPGTTSTLPSGWKYGTSVAANTNTTIVTATLTTSANIDLTKDYGKTVKNVDGSKVTKANVIIGNTLANSLKGGTGADTIKGGDGNDTVYGGSGNDKIYGEVGNDKLYGEAGNDTLYGGNGNDTLTGGAGNDVFVYESGTDVITDYAAGQDKIKISSGTISETTYSNQDVIFTVGDGSITVKNAKGKKITVIDSNNKTTTQTYSPTVALMSSSNFITNDTTLDLITEPKYSVTEIQTPNKELIQETPLLTFTKDK